MSCEQHLLAFLTQLLFVHVVWPDAFDDLEDLIANIESVIKCRTDATGLAF